MNLHAVRVALLLVGIGTIAFLVFLVLVGGCRSSLPAEPAFVQTVPALVRDR